ncbi:PilT protein-like [Sulfuritalea hydrogenivorans sk43H]|uniref:Ribonuclease VapC n=1 Tax=Sulfuritalea hydrogenivorans sk43H TaxID=1223802 RepID=W0SIG1_9PROT|nr:PilT protein-like [Sulfuritalea hydrogenivorans sk43H]
MTSVRYLLDTNILSDLIRYPRGAAARRLAEVGVDAICTSIVVACELRYGAARRDSAPLTQRVEALLSSLSVLPFEADADSHYADIRATLERAGAPIGGNDLLIAAHGRSLGATVVTHNLREFERVPGLRVEDWLAGDPDIAS